MRFIASAISSLTMLATNSRMAWTLRSVSLSGWRFMGQNMTMGGSPQMALKKLKGARLAMPSGEIDEMKPMGRGITAPVRI